MQSSTNLMMKAVLCVACLAVIAVVTVYAAFKISPWPTALMMRRGLDKGGVAIAEALRPYVPADVVVKLNVKYDVTDDDAKLDVFYPSTASNADGLFPAVLWVHGGSWIAGDKDLIANYLKILASRGFITIGVDYSLAPKKTYPTPVRQVNAALGFISKNAALFHVDPSRLFLAGDSAGSQIAAQLANIISAPVYAAEVGIEPSIQRSQLRGVVLHCGMYETKLAKFRRNGVLWAYFGTKDFLNDPRISQFSVARHVTADFPPTFISVGNDDALEPQSHLFADNLAARGVSVDRLFFPPEYAPKLQHEFQFDLGTEAGRLALERSVKFMADQID